MWVDIDQAHLNGRQRKLEFALARIAFVVQPALFFAPIDVFFRLPHIRAATGKAKSLETHGFKGAIASEHHEVSPGNGAAVFLLDRPQEAAGLVEVAVIGPAVQRRETQGSSTRTTAAIAGAIGASAVPRHPDEEGAIMAVIGWPPV